MKKLLPLTLIASPVFAFFPFNGEDTQTLGKGKFQLELQSSHFKSYDGSKETSILTQLTVGIFDNVDLAVFVPYTWVSNGENVRGFGDAGLFIKHVPLRFENTRVGYRAQVNLDTGKRGLGNGTSTYSLNLMLEHNIGSTTLNVNAFYNKVLHAKQDLRDSRGIALGLYRKVGEKLTVGGELNYQVPEEKEINKRDLYLIFGLVYSPVDSLDLSIGFHKNVNKHEGFTDYGVLAGIAYRV